MVRQDIWVILYNYLAPEVLCRLVHNSVADYFALGIITYEMMTGKRPYHGKNRN